MALTMNEAIDALEKMKRWDTRNLKEDEALDMGIQALRKAERYRWHDLEKDPDDLPGEWQLIKGEDIPREYVCVFSGRAKNIRFVHAAGLMEYWGDGDWQLAYPLTIRDLEVHAWRDFDWPAGLPGEEAEE